jgi:hypothetical protein
MGGFTERQARFLVTVMLHAGVCVPRQYATFCRIVHGQKTRKFFAKLARLGFASMYDCRHNRARIYHVNQKALYRAIDDSESRLRRPLTLNHAIQRLMVLDAIVASPELAWLGTAEEKAAHLTALTAINAADLPRVTTGEGDKRTVRYFPGRLPIGVTRKGVACSSTSSPTRCWTSSASSSNAMHQSFVRFGRGRCESRCRPTSPRSVSERSRSSGMSC